MSPEKHALDELRIDRTARQRKPSRAWLGLGLVLLTVLVAGFGWWLNRPKTAEVRLVTVQGSRPPGPEPVLNASGYVTARRRATVSSKATGKIVEVLVDEGMRVQAGQVLARLDDTNVVANLRLAEAQLQSAKAALAETRARLEVAELELKRISQLATNQIASQADWDNAKANAAALQAHLEQQQAEVAVAARQVAVWQQQVDDMVIRAPFSGIVVTKDAQPGEMISPVSAGGGFTRTGICTVVDMNSLEVEVDVNESYINRVNPAQPVMATLDSYPDWKIPAKVIAIIPTADRQKATVKVRIGFDATDSRILPDMGVKVVFQGTAQAPATATGLLIPKSAVRRKDGLDAVLIVKEGRVESRPVTLGSARNDHVMVVSGLASGERVVTDGPPTLVAGQRVKEVNP